jgi:hypothetical protein
MGSDVLSLLLDFKPPVFQKHILIEVLNEIKPYVKILKNTSPEFQWVKLERDFFGFSDDLYICLVYYPP